MLGSDDEVLPGESLQIQVKQKVCKGVSKMHRDKGREGRTQATAKH